MASTLAAEVKNRTRRSSDLFTRTERRHNNGQHLARLGTALGVIGGVFALWSVTFGGPKPIAPPSADSSIAQASMVQSFAVDFVSTYLNSSDAESNAIARYLTAEKYYLPAVRAEADDARPIFVKQMAAAADGVTLWNVIVSVAQPAEQNLATNATPAGAAAPRSFYAVPISLANGSPRALLLPRRVNAPTTGVDVALNYPTQIDPESSFGELSKSFLTAYLVTPADMSRYITTDATIVAPTPSPYSDITVEEIRSDTANQTPTDGATAHLLVTITARTLTYTKTGLTYPLAVVAAGGHWQVSSIQPLPELGADTANPEPPASSTSTAPSSDVPAPTRSSN